MLLAPPVLYPTPLPVGTVAVDVGAVLVDVDVIKVVGLAVVVGATVVEITVDDEAGALPGRH